MTTQTHWVQIEPRRRYRTRIGSKTYNLIYQGRTAVGPDLDLGWYLEGGLDGKGHEFMARRLQDAADTAVRRITQEQPAATGKPYTTSRIPDRPGWHHVYDSAGKLRAFAERRPSWWHLYWASDAEPNPHGRPVRYETLADGADAYTRIPADQDAQEQQ
jgi:hypothetical protein